MNSCRSVSDVRLISTEGTREAVHHAIQLFVGRSRAWSVDDLTTTLNAAGHEISARAVQSWIAGTAEERRTPDTPSLVKLYQLFGPSFTSKVIGPIGQGAHSLVAATGTPAEIIAALVDGSAHFAIRGADGVYCNVDQGALEPVADKMIEILTPFSSKRGG